MTRMGATSPPAEPARATLLKTLSDLHTDRGKKPRPSGDQCGAMAGHISLRATSASRKQASDLPFLWWGGEDLNLRPTDYESAEDGCAYQQKSENAQVVASIQCHGF